MKKLAVMTASAALTALLTASCYAYDNLPAGYTLNNGNPQSEMVSQKFYCYVNTDELTKNAKSYVQNTYIVTHYKYNEVPKYTGWYFSTVSFNGQWDKLSAKAKAGQAVTTADYPVLDMEKYRDEDYTRLITQRGLLNPEKKPELHPVYRFEKINGMKAITASNYIKYADSAIAINTTFVSANDTLYMLTSSQVELPKPVVPVQKDKTEEQSGENKIANTEKTESAPTVGQMKKLLQMEFVTEDKVDKKLVQKALAEHKKFVKTFKAVQPAKVAQPFGYTDTVRGKRVTLPDDWLYQRTNIDAPGENPGKASLIFALPMDTVRKMAANKDVLNYVNTFLDGYDDNATLIDIAKTADTMGKLKNMYASALDDFDQMLFTVSYGQQGHAGKLMNFKAAPLEEMQIRTTIDAVCQQLKNYKSDIFKLNDYSYDVRISPIRAYLDLNSNITLFNKQHLANTMRGAMRDADSDFMVTMAWYMHKEGAHYDGSVALQADEWQF